MSQDKLKQIMDRAYGKQKKISFFKKLFSRSSWHIADDVQFLAYKMDKLREQNNLLWAALTAQNKAIDNCWRELEKKADIETRYRTFEKETK